MYTPNQDSELRQGDVLRGILYPKFDYTKLKFLGTPEFIGEIERLKAERQKDSYTAQLTVSEGDVVVLSQCCELARRDDGSCKASHILCCPLQAYNERRIAKAPQMFAEAKQNTPESYTSNYVFERSEPFKTYLFADFALSFSVPRSAYKALLERKALQLEDKERVRFKLKLGHYLGRPTEEELAAGFWNEE